MVLENEATPLRGTPLDQVDFYTFLEVFLDVGELKKRRKSVCLQGWKRKTTSVYRHKVE